MKGCDNTFPIGMPQQIEGMIGEMLHKRHSVYVRMIKVGRESRKIVILRELIKVQLPLKDHYKAYIRLEG